MESTNIGLTKIHILIFRVNLRKSISIPGYLLLIMIQWRTVAIDDFMNSLLRSNNAFYLIGTFHGLNLRYPFQLAEYINKVFLPIGGHDP